MSSMMIERIDPRSRLKSVGLSDAVRRQPAPLLVGKTSGGVPAAAAIRGRVPAAGIALALQRALALGACAATQLTFCSIVEFGSSA